MGGPFSRANATSSKKKPTLIGTGFAPSGGEVARLDQLSAIDSRLLNYFFKLCAEHIDASIGVDVATKSNVKPIALLAFHSEFASLCDIRCTRCIFSGLRNYIDKQVPSPCL